MKKKTKCKKLLSVLFACALLIGLMPTVAFAEEENEALSSSHTHAWSTEWSTNETHHWHECTATDCDVTANESKDGYGAHVYDEAGGIDCNICGAEKNIAITNIALTITEPALGQ